MTSDGFPSDLGGDSGYELPEIHRSTRMPLDAVVRLHFEGTVAYQNGFAANVSAKGMFVKHPEPPAVGARLVFEFVIGDQRKPVQGAGVVSWTREKYEGPGKPAGVGIEFTEMDALSKQHIAEALFEYLESQLGVELADHPEVENLVEAVPTATPVPLGADPAPRQSARVPPADTPGDGVDASLAPGLRFNVFEDAAAAAAAPAEESSDLFKPEVPPENLDFAERYGQARRRTSPWVGVVIFLLVVGGGFAAWWFLLGPGSLPSHGLAEPAAAAEAAAPVPPPLSADPGPDSTLAEDVGAIPSADDAVTGSEDGADGATDAGGPTATDAEAETPVATPGEEIPTTPALDDAAPAAAPIAAMPPPPAAAGPARRLVQVRWDETAGVTRVHLAGDGSFAPGSYRWYEMPGANPRVLVKLLGMAEAFGKTALPASTPELAGVRVGFHAASAGNEIHVVLDLASRSVRVVGVEPQGNRLDVVLASR